MNEVSVGIALSLATLVVVGAASVAAIVQLRHLRVSNQLSALLEILNQWNLPTVQAAMAELHAVPNKMRDASYVEGLSAPGSIDRTTHAEFLALDFWEQIGTFAKHKLVDEDLMLDIVSGQVADAWKSAEPPIAVIRETRGPSVFENFEYLAVRAEIWQQRHPAGAYPPRTPRMRDLQTREL